LFVQISCDGIKGFTKHSRWSQLENCWSLSSDLTCSKLLWSSSGLITDNSDWKCVNFDTMDLFRVNLKYSWAIYDNHATAETSMWHIFSVRITKRRSRNRFVSHKQTKKCRRVIAVTSIREVASRNLRQVIVTFCAPKAVYPVYWDKAFW
jgi:hypothetical protein